MPRRNEPCPCGSGKKYKRCCLLRDQAVSRTTGEVLARHQTRRNPGRHAHVVRSGGSTVAVKTAPLAEYKREARRLLRIADDLGLTREDLAERTGHSAALVDLDR